LEDFQQEDPPLTREVMHDWVGNPYGVNSLYKEEHRRVWGITNGQTSPNWICSGFYESSFVAPSGASLEPPPSDSAAALEAMANTNPSRPEVDLPVFLFELKDFPRMVRQMGNIVKELGAFTRGDLRKSGGLPGAGLADQYLSQQFGWQPLVGDLARMMDFVGNTERRAAELKRLHSERGLRRNYRVWEDPGIENSWLSYLGPSYGATARGYVKYRTKRSKWVSLEWKPLTAPTFNTDEEAMNEARNLVFGLNLSPASLWEAMPWSWLIDWFSNCGDFLNAHRNRIPVTCTNICVMTKEETVYTDFTFDSNPWNATVKLQNPVYVVKQRNPVGGFLLPEFFDPFLDGRQSAILSSLAINRIGR
jgi:hypothetical protein